MRGRGVGVLPVHLAGQAIAEVIRHQQSVSNVWNKFRLLLRQRTQLIKRIEGQKLDAATLINIAFAELLLCLRH
ncbi:Uncharacterised protein [Shigella sonnei]|nr:Uncharacterised protein [Shigella sonnei]